MGISTSSSYFGATAVLGIAPQMVPGQVFRTVPIPNFRPAVYQIAIRYPFPPNPIFLIYTFGVSPQNVRKEYTALTAIYDVMGSSQQAGVQRIVDTFGLAPVMYTIAGTTGWQYHSTDAVQYTGLQSISALESAIVQYAQLNQQQVENQQSDMYIMEFYDYFTGNYWQVVPVGPQGFYQDVSKPLYVNYQFRLAGVQPLNAPPIQAVDVVLAGFLLTFSQAAENVVAFANNVSSDYAALTQIVPE